MALFATSSNRVFQGKQVLINSYNGLGCKWLQVATGKWQPPSPPASFHNKLFTRITVLDFRMSFRNRPCGIVHRGRCLLFSFHATCPVLQRKALSRCMQEIQDLSPRTYEHFIRIGPLKLGQSRTNQLSFFIRPHSKQPAVCCRQDHARRPHNNSDHNAVSALVGRHTIHRYSTPARGIHAPDSYCRQRTRYGSHFPRWLACHPQVSKYRLLA